MKNKEYELKPTPWLVWIIVGILGLFSLVIIYAMIDIYFLSDDEEYINDNRTYETYTKESTKDNNLNSNEVDVIESNQATTLNDINLDEYDSQFVVEGVATDLKLSQENIY